MVTLIFFCAVKLLPPTFTTATTSDDLPILIRVEIKPFALLAILKLAANGVPLFLVTILIDSTPGIVVEIVIGSVR